MNATLHRWRRRLLEFVRYNPTSGRLLSHLLQCRAFLDQDPVQKLKRLAHAARLCPCRKRAVELNRSIQAILAELDMNGRDWKQLDPSGQSLKRELPKSLIVKAPVSPLEKGLLYITFENQWLRLVRQTDLSQMAQEYDLLLGPSYSPPPGPELFLLLKHWPGRVFSLLSNHDDAKLLRAFSQRIQTLPLLASSWVDPEPFVRHLQDVKDFDLVMLANFSPLKRHWLFFDTLRQMPSRTKVLLLGLPMDGRDEKNLRDEAKLFGVEDRFELILKPTRAQVMNGLARSRVSLVFSQQEGACIAVTESFFANTPVGLFRTCRIGSKAFINGWTGRLLDRTHLASQLMDFVESSGRYQPRAWALEHIAAPVSVARLNRLMREHAAKEGLPWTCDVVPFAKHTVPVYLSPGIERQMQTWVERFEDDYGIVVGQRPAPASLAKVAA